VDLILSIAAYSPAPSTLRPANRAWRIAAVIVAAVVVLAGSAIAATPAYAAAVSSTPDGMTFSADDSDPGAGATVTSYDATVASGGFDVVIPSSVTIDGKTYPVTAIGEDVFHNKGLTSVVIPTTVKTIGYGAFAGNTLSFVDIPDSVITIGESAFYDTGLTAASLGNSVETIENYAFEENDLATVVIPDSVTEIGEYAFNDNALTSVTLGSSLVTIMQSAFFGNLLTAVVLPDSLVTIGGGAFFGSDLTSVTFPASIATIGPGAFKLNDSLSDVVFLGAAPTTFTPAGPSESLGASPSILVHYGSAFASPAAAAGFTSPTWQGYSAILNPIVTFNLSDHGTAIAPTEVPFGTAMEAPTEPTASGYTFTGWYTDAAMTTRADFSTVIADDATLFAGWTASAASMLPATGSSVPLLPIGALAILLLAAGIALRRRMA
jgi:uncharacterized repeat protein (TIGR02543 family)/LPXTG-motif cell wall-anchored protein